MKDMDSGTCPQIFLYLNKRRCQQVGMSFVIINIGSQDRVVHSLFLARLEMLWITQCCAVDNFGNWRLWITLVLLLITILIGV